MHVPGEGLRNLGWLEPSLSSVLGDTETDYQGSVSSKGSSSWEEGGRSSNSEAVLHEVRDEEGLAAGDGREADSGERHLEVEFMALSGLLGGGETVGVKMTLRSLPLVIRGSVI